MLAEARQRAGDADGAIALYEQVLRNVAGQRRAAEQPCRAVRLQGRSQGDRSRGEGVQGCAQAAAVQDTYGWILLQKGRTDEAAPLLAEANKGMPDNAEVQYHYAALLAKQGKNAEAVALLRKAVAGKLPATAKADAEKLLQQLVK